MINKIIRQGKYTLSFHKGYQGEFEMIPFVFMAQVTRSLIISGSVQW